MAEKKKRYSAPELDILLLKSEDICDTSTTAGAPDPGTSGGGGNMGNIWDEL